jgi:hypothetical protein
VVAVLARKLPAAGAVLGHTHVAVVVALVHELAAVGAALVRNPVVVALGCMLVAVALVPAREATTGTLVLVRKLATVAAASIGSTAQQ